MPKMNIALSRRYILITSRNINHAAEPVNATSASSLPELTD
jgi:hypothetical protein